MSWYQCKATLEHYRRIIQIVPYRGIPDVIFSRGIMLWPMRIKKRMQNKTYWVGKVFKVFINVELVYSSSKKLNETRAEKKHAAHKTALFLSMDGITCLFDSDEKCDEKMTIAVAESDGCVVWGMNTFENHVWKEQIHNNTFDMQYRFF